MSALSVSPQANPCLSDELTGKEQKSLVDKEEISHSVSEAVITLSQLRSLVTNQNVGKPDFTSIFFTFFFFFLVIPISTILEREERQGAEIIRAAFACLFPLCRHMAPCPGGCQPQGRSASAAGPRASPLFPPAPAAACAPSFPVGQLVGAAGATSSCGDGRRGPGPRAASRFSPAQGEPTPRVRLRGQPPASPG